MRDFLGVKLAPQGLLPVETDPRKPLFQIVDRLKLANDVGNDRLDQGERFIGFFHRVVFSLGLSLSRECHGGFLMEMDVGERKRINEYPKATDESIRSVEAFETCWFNRSCLATLPRVFKIIDPELHAARVVRVLPTSFLAVVVKNPCLEGS